MFKGLLQAWGRAPTVRHWDSWRLPGPPQWSHGYLPSVPVHGLALGTFRPNSLRNPVSVLLSAAGSPRGSSRRMSQNFATRARASSFRCPQSQLPQARWLTLHNHIGGECGEHQCSFGGLSWVGWCTTRIERSREKQRLWGFHGCQRVVHDYSEQGCALVGLCLSMCEVGVRAGGVCG